VAKLKGGLEVFYQKQLAEVMDGIESFPPILSLEEQGSFALGYYHQRQEFYKRPETAPADSNENEKGEAA